jgi:hypothetical protein
MRRTVMRKGVLRALRAGGPCIAPAAAASASGRSANTTAGARAATEVPTDSRALALVRSAGVPPAWS